MKILVIGSDGQLGLEFQKISNSFGSLSWIFSTIKTLDLSEVEVKSKKQSLDKFISNGFPSRKLEDWKFSDINQIIQICVFPETLWFVAEDS